MESIERVEQFLFRIHGLMKLLVRIFTGIDVFQPKANYDLNGLVDLGEKDKKRRGWNYYFSRRLQEHTHVCWSKTSNVPSISYVQCTNPMECQARGACFQLVCFFIIEIIKISHF